MKARGPKSKACLYCGKAGKTADHVPPRSFLEKVYLDNLQTVPACAKCNNGFAPHEQYVIALLAQIGTSEKLAAKIKQGGTVDRAFERSPAFEQRFLA